jgi:AcrR family transcriptional regulator
VRFFAEVGFDGQTRALAERLGVTQPLLYRYFADKEALIERVFDEVYMKRWRPEWETLLGARDRPLAERLIEFYQNYCRAIFRPEWVRIFMFAGLKGEGINQRYLTNVIKHVLEPICTEYRHDLKLPAPEELPLDETEINLAWALHGAIFYIAVRKWIYKLPVPDDFDMWVRDTVLAYLQGSGASVERIVKARQKETALSVVR